MRIIINTTILYYIIKPRVSVSESVVTRVTN